jgi:lysophospholipase L1-like esterase
MALLVAPSLVLGQNTADNIARMIDASQAGAMPLFFSIEHNHRFAINPAKFNHPSEFYKRGGLPNFFWKLKKKKALTIGYLGGSISRADEMYRLQSAAYIKSLKPEVSMKGVNAGVSGTGTDLGACRLYDQLLRYKPDLIFVEFSVNGAFPDGMEGIIRQIRKFDPSIDICMLHSVYDGQYQFYARNEVPANIARLEKIADHYQIPSVHMGLYPALLEKESKLVWKGKQGENSGKITFSYDGVHPSKEGGDLYAGAIARAFNQMKSKAEKKVHTLPDPLIADNWEDARMYAPREIASFSNGWTSVDPASHPNFKQFQGWFPYVMKADKPGESLSFKFKGNMLGIFDIGGPEVGQLNVQVDGKNIKVEKTAYPEQLKTSFTDLATADINRFNVNCNNRYRGQYLMLNLPEGMHEVVMTVSATKADKKSILGKNQLADITANPAKYDQTVIYLGKILVRGEIKR